MVRKADIKQQTDLEEKKAKKPAVKKNPGKKAPAKKAPKAKNAAPKKPAAKSKPVPKKPTEKKDDKDLRLLIQVPKKLGRPKIEINAKLIERAFELACRGLHDYQIAAGLGMHKDTFIEKKKEFSDFSESIEEGRAIASANMSNAVYEMGLSGNIHAAKYWLNNKDPEHWRDKKEYDVNTTEKPREITQEEIEKMDDDELERISKSKNVVLIGAKK